MKLAIGLIFMIGLFHGSLAVGGYFGATWQCSGGFILPCASRCDGEQDCADNSDEFQCAPPLVCQVGHRVLNLDNGISIIVSEQHIVSITATTATLNIYGVIKNKISCGSIPLISGAVVTLNNMDSSFGATADVTCDDGYETCKKQIRCLCSGTWQTAVCSPIPTDAIGCFTCNNENSNEVCNQNRETCNANKQSCQTVVEWRKNGNYKISKACINPDVGKQNLGCRKVGPKTVCRYNCEDNLCNELISTDCRGCGETEDDDGEAGSCRSEHGPCSRRTYDSTESVALRTSNCRKYCQCTHDPETGSYRWQRQTCEDGELFDNGCGKCRPRRWVKCRGPNTDDCSRRYGICNEDVMTSDGPMDLPNSQCKKYCEPMITGRMARGMPIFSWRKQSCNTGQMFDKQRKRCRPARDVTCRDIET